MSVTKKNIVVDIDTVIVCSEGIEISNKDQIGTLRNFISKNDIKRISILYEKTTPLVTLSIVTSEVMFVLSAEKEYINILYNRIKQVIYKDTYISDETVKLWVSLIIKSIRNIEDDISNDIVLRDIFNEEQLKTFILNVEINLGIKGINLSMSDTYKETYCLILNKLKARYFQENLLYN